MHARVGVRERLEQIGPRVLREFYARTSTAICSTKLPMLVVGSLDAQRRPWASVHRRAGPASSLRPTLARCAVSAAPARRGSAARESRGRRADRAARHRARDAPAQSRERHGRGAATRRRVRDARGAELRQLSAVHSRAHADVRCALGRRYGEQRRRHDDGRRRAHRTRRGCARRAWRATHGRAGPFARGGPSRTARRHLLHRHGGRERPRRRCAPRLRRLASRWERGFRARRRASRAAAFSIGPISAATFSSTRSAISR